MIGALMLLTFASLTPTDLERGLVERAVSCTYKRVDPYFLLSILRLEDTASVPEYFRGISLATGCIESRFNPRALGDCNYGYRRCMARGFAQLWPWWERRYGVDRWDPHHSIETYLFHVTRQLRKARKICRQTGERLWRTAEARAVRSGGKKRCGESTAHYRLLRKWRRVMRNKNRGSPHHPNTIRTKVKKNELQSISKDASRE